LNAGAGSRRKDRRFDETEQSNLISRR